ncbi:4,5-DOPA dioxygenase extradiol [Aestuariibaculum sp. YM273]|uniref:4,5-DOPA-extradiol-dioxygenase n=1 Tax=Aestuariibaculum sp. YM273 TaxID=3070659 RepID=UPI0027DBBD15|nr:4,5-DOPA dioxygenase extradiol [Aestuariibaculum sp. YM273]WMI64751.1 4,5-DOPA dioxygenase extradiol [Aestuariibaculum sp. YM273]
MDRKKFLKSLAVLPLIGSSMNLKDLEKMTSTMSNTGKMPVLFLGHGSPMNAIEENEFVQNFRKLGQELTRPNAILCISAHWETRGTFVTAMQNPPTIHDFGGFPQALFDVQYPAPGSPELAQETKNIITKTEVGLDEKWGLDHGAWSVIKHLYPNADIPVIQMSIDYTQSPKYHYELAQQLYKLRHKGVLIIGSGNMVHNLRMVAWNKLNEEYAYDWATEANEKMKSFILNNDHNSLINFRSQGKAFDLAIPTPEHYLPLLYTLALKEDNEKVTLFNDKPVAGSLTMTSLKIDNI